MLPQKLYSYCCNEDLTVQQCKEDMLLFLSHWIVISWWLVSRLFCSTRSACPGPICLAASPSPKCGPYRGGKIFPYSLSGSLAGSSNILKVNKRKTNLILFIWDMHKNIRSKGSQANWGLYAIPKEWDGVWDFKGKEGNSQEDRRAGIW